MASDRIFGLFVVAVALAYIASATQIQTSLLSDPVGPKSFPVGIGVVTAICGLYLIIRPDESPTWPVGRTFFMLLIAVAVLTVYAFSLKTLGFLLPTAITSAILSFQIHSNYKTAVFTGFSLSVLLFFVFKYALGLGLVAFPKALTGS